MNEKLRATAVQRRGWFSRGDVLAAGYSDSELRARLRRGQWARLARDAFVEAGEWPAEPPWERARRVHTLTIRAVTERLDAAAISHQSAVVLHGLPIWGLDLSRVHVTRSAGRVRSGPALIVHRSLTMPEDVTEVDGVQATCVERAIAETICRTSYEVGVVLADAALRCGLTAPGRLVAMADRHRHWSGSPAARAAVRFANGLSESAGEDCCTSEGGGPVRGQQLGTSDT